LNEALDKRARELALSNAELEQFAYVASHDLQEPLRMVTGFISRLDTQYGDGLDERARQYMRFAVDGAKRMRQLILDLLAFSRAGRQSEAKTSFSVTEVIHGVCELQKSLIAEKQAEVIVGNMPSVNSYKTAFRQIFQNLISNALKYSEPDRPARVEITCDVQDQEWIFAVKDNGIGIHPEYFEKVFVIFQRLHQQDNFGGTGIGLAIVKKQVENLGGRIWVESEEGQGTCFYFSLPGANES
jgi:light-regulated signal transduction histidine kinase (bacteriophytochrome)